MVNEKQGYIESPAIRVAPGSEATVTTFLSTRIPVPGLYYSQSCAEDQPIPPQALHLDSLGTSAFGLRAEYFNNPDLHGKPLLIRHMLNHTSGLRDWGEVEGIAGWPRTSRVYTHAHVLDIVSRQRALNFEPGTNWSYSNTGYNLAAIVVSRVSGQPFAEFCRRHGLKLVSVAELIRYRLSHERFVQRTAEGSVETEYGPFKTVVYQTPIDPEQHLALVRGAPAGRENDDRRDPPSRG